MAIVTTDDRNYKDMADVIREYGDTPEVAADVTQYLPEEMPGLMQQVALTQYDNGHSEGFGIGYDQGLDEGYSEGYSEGHEDGSVEGAWLASPHGIVFGEMVRIDDAIALESTLPVEVRRKNLYNNVDYGFISPPNSVVFTATKTETGYSVIGASSSANWILIPLCSLAELGGKSVTLSADISGTPDSPCLVICDKDYGNRKILYGGTFDGGAISFSVPQASNYPDGYIVAVRLKGDKNNDTAAVVTYDNIQVEIGKTATAYAPYVDDLSAVTLTKTGLNIWDEQWRVGIVYANGSITYNTTSNIMSSNPIPVKAGVKLRCVIPQMIRVVLYDANKAYLKTVYPKTGGTVTPDQDGYMRICIGDSVSGMEAVTAYGNNICISVDNGSADSVYEPYKVETYVPNEDGTVDGIIAYDGTTTLFTGVSGVIVNCEYAKTPEAAYTDGTQAEYDRFWDAFQQNGKRGEYQNAFWIWTDEIYNPKYSIFGGLIAAYQGSSITDTKVAIRSTGSLNNTFRGCTNLVRIPSIDFTNTSAFTNSTFQNCNVLVEVNAVGEISVGGLDAHWSPLSRASIESIVGCLSTTTSGLSITLSNAAVVAAFTDEEWATLANTRPNWTINLV